ncbi:glycine cleavage system protein GcvH [Aneurinibacillus migulanus]|uniref:glycine cleavage system protein GcvH n=1 Tax=Aneurinibacillus migulanus TaxID=47500 RepID=UPI00209D05EA|nr:glycine cleavage system protein GcvH [Aneurinibacillus migulanus]
MSQTVSSFLYSKEHEWVEIIKGNLVKIGITNFAQNQLGDIVFVELPQEGEEITANESMGTVESVKAVSEIFSPVSGKVTQMNGDLEDTPEIINSEPYGQGWMVTVELNNPDELKELMTAEQYSAFVEEE